MFPDSLAVIIIDQHDPQLIFTLTTYRNKVYVLSGTGMYEWTDMSEWRLFSSRSCIGLGVYNRYTCSAT